MLIEKSLYALLLGYGIMDFDDNLRGLGLYCVRVFQRNTVFHCFFYIETNSQSILYFLSAR